MAAFNQRGVEIACKATRKAAAARILERSEELRRYKAFLSLEVRCPSPPGPGPLPFSLPLEGQLRIQWGGKGEPQRLQSFAFTCSEVGKVAADLDLSDARENLRRILVNGQRESSDLLVQNLQARLKAAPVKTRLTVEPKRIKEPSDQIKLGLELKTGGMLALAGTWDVESLTYRLPDDAQERLAEFLKPPAPPPPPPPPKPKPPQKAKAEKPVKAPIERAPRKGGRRGTAVGAAVVVIAAVAVGLLFRGQPPPGKPASIAPALDKVKALLGVSAHLGPFVGELIDTNGTVSSDARDITVQLPGLAESVQTVALTRAETPQGDIWRLADGQAERLRERVAGLDALLDVGGLEFEPSSPSTVRIDRLAAMLSSISADGALKRGRVTARLPDDLEWNLSAQQNAWTTSPVELTLGFQPEGQAAVENGNRVELARVPVALQATNGSVTADFHADDALAALERQIRDRLAKPPPSIEPAVEELKAMLRASAHLDSIVDQLIESGEPADGRPPTLAYRLPGLAQSRQAVELEVEASGERDLWHMAEGQAERVRQRVADLDALLDVAVIEAATEEVLGDVLDKPGLAGLIRPSQVSIRIIESADWQPKLQHDSWETRSVTANVVFRLSAGAPPEANISLAHLTAVWVAESGTVTVAGEAADLEAELARQIQQSLTDRRRALAQDLSAQLTEEAALAQAQLAGPVASSTQPANLEYSAACPMLQPRTLTATWDPATLRFDATAAQRELADLRTAVAVLQELNKPKPADHWLTQGSKDSLIEVAAPREGTWVLGAIAPWSAAGDYATAPATDRLHLSVDWDSVAKPQDPGQAAHALLSAGLVRPEYWPLIEEYQRYAGQPSPEWSSALLRTLAAGLDPQSAERLNELLTNQGSVRVGLKLDGPPVATATSEGEPESLELRFSGKLTLAQNGPQLPSGTDVAELSGRIEKVFAESFTITLSVVDGDVKTASKDAARWMAALARSVDTAKDIVEAVFVAQRERERQLAEQQLKDQQLREQQLREQQLREQQLREQKQREQQPPPEEKIPPAGGDVKRQLDAALSGRASADLDQGTAFELLKGIWAGKGTTPPPGVADLLSLSQALRRIYSGENQPDPTIFIECFCSADNAYALVWSASWGQSRLGGGAGIKEGPKLLRSDARGNPSAALTAILEAVPLASNAKASFGFVLGVVVGSTNDCLPGIMNAPLNRHSQLEAGVPDTPWTSLSELNELHRRKRLRCAAWIRPSLGGS